jgi:hypothetical protein
MNAYDGILQDVESVYGRRSDSPVGTHSILVSVPRPSQNGFKQAGNRTRSTRPVSASMTAPFSSSATMSRGIAAAVPFRVCTKASFGPLERTAAALVDDSVDVSALEGA